MRITRSFATWLTVAAGSIVSMLVGGGTAAHGQDALLAQAASGQLHGEATARECLFIEGTAIPRLAMGVCRPGDPPDLRSGDELMLWETTSPVEGDEPAAIRPLFFPLYVYEERPGIGTTWYRLGDAYAAPRDGATKGSGPLGWVDGRRLHLLDSRYAYHFSNPNRVKPGVHLYATKQAAYAALEAQQRKPPTVVDDGVLVAERFEEDSWNPLASGAIPPFVEMLPAVTGTSAGGPSGQSEDAGLTDTTLTFPQPSENRLIRLGAVCGGPVDQGKLATLQAEAQARAGIEIVFVIDETLSMKRWFPEVADFINKNLAMGGNSTNVKVAVSWYSDQTYADRGPPHNANALAVLLAPEVPPDEVVTRKEQIVEMVKTHAERIVKGDTNPQELVFEGLITAIEAAEFTPGENAMVFVIGDAGDRSRDKVLGGLQDRVRDAILRHNLQVAFIQVGDPNDPDKDFVAQAEDLRDKLPPEKQKSVLIQPVNDKSLAMRIADIQARMDARRQVLLREIEQIETRNRYSKPGPVMERLIEKNGLTVKEFDDRNLQYFKPAYGWLYHPQQPDATPQLRELVFLAKPEEDALMAALIEVARHIRTAGKVDGDAAVAKLAGVLGKNSGHSRVEAALQAAWKAMPVQERTLGAFLRDAFGLRVRNAILFHRGDANAGPATERAAQLLEEHKERVFRDRTRAPTRAGLPRPVWHDAWKVLP